MNAILSGDLILQDAPAPVALEAMTRHTFEAPDYRRARLRGYGTRGLDSELRAYRVYSDGSLHLGRGFLPDLLELAPGIEVIDERTEAPVRFNHLAIDLRPYQARAVDSALKHDQGTTEAPTGSGKTVMGLALIQQREQRALILVHTRELLNQWRDRVRAMLGIEAGIIGGGQWQEGEQVTVCMFQTLTRRPEDTEQMAAGYGLVLVDEAHHVPAATFARTLAMLPCRYRYGLTATPYRRDGLTPLLRLLIGPTIARVTPAEVEAARGIVPAVIRPVRTGWGPGPVDSWQAYIERASRDLGRHQFVISVAARSVRAGIPTLILVERIDHTEGLGAVARGRCINTVVLHGALTTRERQAAFARIHDAPLTIGTTGLLGEGFDAPAWGALVLAIPISGKARVLQAVGRILRPAPGKQTAYVADLIDHCAFSGASYKRRRAVYQERGFRVLASRERRDMFSRQTVGAREASA